MFSDPATALSGEFPYYRDTSELLTYVCAAANQILISDMAKDPSMRQQSREFLETLGRVTVNPTERGQTIIDEYHIYYVSTET